MVNNGYYLYNCYPELMTYHGILGNSWGWPEGSTDFRFIGVSSFDLYPVGNISIGFETSWFFDQKTCSRKRCSRGKSNDEGFPIPIPRSYGYESIPINTIFSGMNIHKSQLFWCEQKGYKVLTHCHISLYPQSPKSWWNALEWIGSIFPKMGHFFQFGLDQHSCLRIKMMPLTQL